MIEHLTATDLGRAAWRHPGHRRASYLLHSVLSTLILSDLLISLYHLLFVSVQISHSRPACELCVSKNVIMPSLSSLHSSLHQSLWRLFTAAWLWVVSCLLSPAAWSPRRAATITDSDMSFLHQDPQHCLQGRRLCKYSAVIHLARVRWRGFLTLSQSLNAADNNGGVSTPQSAPVIL